MQEDNLQKKDRLEIFKYNVLLSALLFLASTYYLGFSTKYYSFTEYTISQMSYFLNGRTLSFFNFLFFFKCILDLGFTMYVFKKFEGKLNLFTSAVWLIAVLTFGLLGFFPVSQFFYIHWFFAICLFLFWTISEHAMAKITGDTGFLWFSNRLIVVQVTVAAVFIVSGFINAIFETIYFLMVFLWLTVFVNKYLN